VILSVTAQQAEVIKFAQLQGSISLVLRSPKDFFDENGQPVLPVPPGTTGVILKTLVDGGYGVLRPELVEAILPKQ
jgi:Flp pilus assembly protein CpaB